MPPEPEHPEDPVRDIRGNDKDESAKSIDNKNIISNLLEESVLSAAFLSKDKIVDDFFDWMNFR